MKCQSVLISTIFLLNLTIHNKAVPQELSWVFTKTTRDNNGQEKNETITYCVSPEITRIEYTDKIIYINYCKLIFYRYNKTDDRCLKYQLNSNNVNESSGTKENSANGNISLISSLKVESTTEHKEFAYYNCSLKRVMFGGDLMLFQMVAPVVVHEFGQKFTESMVSFCVSNEVTGLNTLFKIAQQRSDIFKNNPLLRQVDIVGLFEILNGFPVQTTQRLHNTASVTTLLEKPEQITGKRLFLLPEGCRDK